MVPHKTPRGAAALSHLKVFEGVPPPYDKVHTDLIFYNFITILFIFFYFFFLKNRLTELFVHKL